MKLEKYVIFLFISLKVRLPLLLLYSIRDEIKYNNYISGVDIYLNVSNVKYYLILNYI